MGLRLHEMDGKFDWIFGTPCGRYSTQWTRLNYNLLIFEQLTVDKNIHRNETLDNINPKIEAVYINVNPHQKMQQSSQSPHKKGQMVPKNDIGSISNENTKSSKHFIPFQYE